MAILGKYGKIKIPKIGDDEPIFILRAQNYLAAAAIEMYQSLACSYGAPLVESLKSEIESFRQWKGNKKIPD